MSAQPCPADASSEERRSSEPFEKLESEPNPSLEDALSQLAGAIREQNENHRELLLAVLQQNAMLIEALAKDDEGASDTDLSGNPISA